jgi:hypothetical protein
MKVGLCVDDPLAAANLVVTLEQDNELEGIWCVRASVQGMYGISCESETSGDLGERD